MKLKMLTALGTVLVLVNACAVPKGGPLLPFAAVTASQSAFYGNHVVISAARGGMMPIVIVNSPFGVGSADDIAAAMRSPAWAGNFQFQPTDAGTAPDLRVVMAFDTTASAFGRSTICRSPSASQVRGGLRVVAAFCNGGEPLSIAGATSPRPRGIADGGFTRMIGSISTALFPLVDHSQQSR